MAGRDQLTVAVTGPTGTLGLALLPLLEDDGRVARVVGVARRPFDPVEHGWSKLDYRRGDVRRFDTLRDAFAGADVVVHLAFLITGTTSRDAARDINVGGTLHAFRAACDVGARRFVYASSVAAYGFHRDNPVGMTEDWPTRPARRLHYAQEKAELEALLDDAARLRATAGDPVPDRYVLRPPIVLGPHTLGAKELLPRPLEPLLHAAPAAARALRRSPVPVPLLVPALPFQVVHADDVATALLACIAGDGRPGAYNIAADGVLTAQDVARELGVLPLPFPTGLTGAAARLAAAVPTPSFVPPALEWVEVAGHPAIMDTARARTELGWAPRFTAVEALRDTIGS